MRHFFEPADALQQPEKFNGKKALLNGMHKVLSFLPSINMQILAISKIPPKRDQAAFESAFPLVPLDERATTLVKPWRKAAQP